MTAGENFRDVFELFLVKAMIQVNPKPEFITSIISNNMHVRTTEQLIILVTEDDAPTPLQVVEDALDLKNGVHGSLNEELNPGQHTAHNIISTPHETESHQEEIPSSEALIPFTNHPVSDDDVPLSDPPSPSAPHPQEKTPELPRYSGWLIDPDTVIEKNSRFGQKLNSFKVWRKNLSEKLKILANWFRRIFDRSPRRFSNKKPHRELYVEADTNLATKIDIRLTIFTMRFYIISTISHKVLDGNQIKQSAQAIKSDVINELKSFIPDSRIAIHRKGNEAEVMLQKFAQIEDITKWEEVSSEDSRSVSSLVRNIISSMQDEVKSSSDSGYVNANAGDYFLEHIFESLNDIEVERMWRALLDSEAEFKTVYQQASSPGRYNNFLEQLHFEWAETIERRAHIRDFQAAIDREEVPEELKSDILKLKDNFSRLQMWKSWPLIDKGYYENSFSIVSRIKAILRHPVTRYTDDQEEKVSKTVRLAYQALNHIYRFDLQTKKTPTWLIDTLDDKDVQKSLYLHVLSNEGLSHRNVAGMSLLNDFDLKAHLDQSMQEYLTKGTVLFDCLDSFFFCLVFESYYSLRGFADAYAISFEIEMDTKFYSVLPSEIIKEHGDNKLQNYLTSREHIAGIYHEGSFQFDKDFKNMVGQFSNLKVDDMINTEKPDYRLAMKLDDKSNREDLLEIPAKEKHAQASKTHGDDLSQDNTENSEDRISNAVHSALENLKKLSGRSPTLGPEEQASIEILSSLISSNYLAWHLARSELKDSPDGSLLKYLELLKIKAMSLESSDERVFVEKQLNFLVDMRNEIDEYEKIQTTTKKLNGMLKAHNFLERLSQTWFETRWTRVEGGGYDVNIVDLAKDSLALIQSQAFAHMPKGLDTEFVHVLSDLEGKDSTGFFRKYYQDAVSDTTNYNTYQFFTKALSHIENYQAEYPLESPEAKSLEFFRVLKQNN
ncbi:uncharacterized protein MELLADRAFT_63889 [Melampsora larici-populina 98AG31]|uniref:Uncharacterized protein n=1 Tax=Melampsora larici-populina (strain 98AG31 / pathotype 3-4-7) TaxID=747676 RepID=F4RNW2_MELLP|nr:uncharacterized protein MELLADRAFT_63889 [Melampsora larici-populina 98AG31]EGG05816.1 hypothetical protein MELLADRAFT_63889 [Melampsora larici-populina 98AG31]